MKSLFGTQKHSPALPGTLGHFRDQRPRSCAGVNNVYFSMNDE
jgi:hypothetical protein